MKKIKNKDKKNGDDLEHIECCGDRNIIGEAFNGMKCVGVMCNSSKDMIRERR